MKRAVELLAPLLLLWGWSCSTGSARQPTGGETHFLSKCSTKTDCGSVLDCVCGVCTLACASQAECAGLPAAACAEPGDPLACGSAAPARRCDAPCAVDSDCRTISSRHRCANGACREPSSGSGGAAGSGGGAGAPGCEPGDVSGNDVLVVGDSVLGATHQITAYLEELARNEGALGVGERYRDHSGVVSNTLAFGERGIASQYAAATADAPVAVVVMNGGGTDALLGSCEEPTPECPLLVEAGAAVTDLLAVMAEDGVQHVVYAYYPDYADESLRAKLDALRPLVVSACAASPVPCHVVDLRPVYAGRLGDYTDASGILPSAAGAEASARAIWSLMRTECIAQ